MPVTDAYGDAATYRGIFGLNDATKDASILLDLTAVSRYVEGKLGRFFTQDAAVLARKYPATGVRTLNVDDISTTTGLVVKLDENDDGTPEKTLTLTTDFELRPLNAEKGPEPGPYAQLYLPSRVSRSSWDYLVEVTAKFGWPAIPAAVARFTYHVTGILRMDSSQATSRIPEDIDKTVQASPRGRELLDEMIRTYGKPVWIYS